MHTYSPYGDLSSGPMENFKAKQPRLDEAAPEARHSKPESPIVAAPTTSLQALPKQVLDCIVREAVMVVQGHRRGLRILPLVSRTLLRRLQDLSLALGRLRGEQALSVLQQHRLAADGECMDPCALPPGSRR